MEHNNKWNDSSRRRVSTNSSQERTPRPRFSVYQDNQRRSFRSGENKENRDSESQFNGRPSRPRMHRDFNSDNHQPQQRPYRANRPQGDRPQGERQERSEGTFRPRRQFNSSNYSQRKQLQYRQQREDPNKEIRLNKFLANAGVCSRREADDFIQAGVITVNGEVVSTLGAKVKPTDKVMFHDQPIRRERKVYVLLNKPKNCVTTTDDPEERMTVIDIVKNACSERIYPVGRLDRNTTGVLLLTNDGDLAAKLTHPKFGKKKVYAATIDRDLTAEDYDIIMSGIQLDDDLIIPDAMEFIKDDRRHLGLEIHSGQNRVVRRIFEKVGYKVMQLDRVSFAGLTKKNVPRGKYRFLTPKEVAMLQMGAFE